MYEKYRYPGEFEERSDVFAMAADNATRQKIIDAMYHLIAEYGYDKASLSKLCDAVGITKPSIYYYFQSDALCMRSTVILVNSKNDRTCS